MGFLAFVEVKFRLGNRRSSGCRTANLRPVLSNPPDIHFGAAGVTGCTICCNLFTYNEKNPVDVSV